MEPYKRGLFTVKTSTEYSKGQERKPFCPSHTLALLNLWLTQNYSRLWADIWLSLSKRVVYIKGSTSSVTSEIDSLIQEAPQGRYSFLSCFMLLSAIETYAVIKIF